jgi:hypothetical protein
MDNSIIDSCREASGEAKFAGHVGGDVIFKSINNSNVSDFKICKLLKNAHK